MKSDNEKQIRTDSGNLLFCTAEVRPDGEVELIARNKGKEGRITMNSLLFKVYGETNKDLSK